MHVCLTIHLYAHVCVYMHTRPRQHNTWGQCGDAGQVLFLDLAVDYITGLGGCKLFRVFMYDMSMSLLSVKNNCNNNEVW